MRNTIKSGIAATFGMILSISAMTAPMTAEAAKVPGTCDLVKNTDCNPASLLDQILNLFGFSLA